MYNSYIAYFFMQNLHSEVIAWIFGIFVTF